jgi:cytochrome c553
MKADEQYLKQCIEDPTVHVVKGYPATLMQKYKGKLSDQDIGKIIEYIKTLQ